MINVDGPRVMIKGDAEVIFNDFLRLCLGLQDIAVKEDDMAVSLAYIFTFKKIFDDVMSGEMDGNYKLIDTADDAKTCFTRDMALNDIFKDVKGEPNE